MPTHYPDVDQLRRQAKRLLRQANDGDPQALRLFARSDRPLRLADAQYAVAKVVGFSSWPAMIGAVESTGAATAVERTTRLVLVRGCSGDAEGRFFEHQGPGLNEDGRRQARAAANRLADLVDPALLDPVMSSHRPRSIETAREIAAALDVPFGGPTCDLCQMHPGDAEGLTQQQMIERFGGNYAFVPGAESWPEFIPRATAALMSVVEQHGGRTVIAVTESAVIKASFVAFGGMPVGGAATITTSEGSLTEWSCLVEGDIRRMGTWRLERCNDTPLE